MKRLLAILLCAAALAAQSGPEVLRAKCQGCHNAKNRASGLALDTRDAVLAGGNRGSAAAPGKPGESRLVSAIRHSGELKMPPGGKLSQTEIAAVERWIESGLDGMNGPEAKSAPKHWAFTPASRPAEPAVGDAGFARNPIDKFVLARLEKEGLAPSAEASRETLLRRVSFDLTGLPPTPAEMALFAADRSEGAYERAVERLLSSPH